MPDTNSTTDSPSQTESPSSTALLSALESDAPPNADALLDAARDCEGVPVTEDVNVHEDRDHCAVGIEGRAIVGVTDDAGEVLLAVHEESSVAMLAHGEVETGDDWLAVGREAVELVSDVPFEIDGVAVVREVDHVVEGEDDPHTTTVNVVFEAALAGDRASAADPGIAANDHWDADWFDAVPEATAEAGDLMADDVRLFVG